MLDALRSLIKTSPDIIIKYNCERDGLLLIPCDHSGWNERLELVMPRHL
jgi:hypothetical protein